MKKKTNPVEEGPEEQDASIEELFGQMEEIIEKLTDEKISLEDSFKWYESGTKLVKTCNGKIVKVEKQILVLNEGNT